MKKIVAYVSGSCLGNPGVGGYACVMTSGGLKRKTCGACTKQTTNNGTVLDAVINGVQWLNKYQKEPCEITVYTTSDYIVKTCKKTYRELFDKDRKNHEKWQELVCKRNAGKHRIVFKKLDKEADKTLMAEAQSIAHEKAIKARHEVYDRKGD